MKKFEVSFVSFDRFDDEFIEMTWNKTMSRRGVVKARRLHKNASDSFMTRVRSIKTIVKISDSVLKDL